MDVVFIRDLLVRGILGINDDERRDRQDILINVDMTVDTRPAAESDDIASAVNYRTIAKSIIEHVERSQDFLVERLARDLCDLILEGDTRIAQVRLRVEKPGALRFARSVGLEVVRRRNDG